MQTHAGLSYTRLTQRGLCVSGTGVSCANTDEPIDMPLDVRIYRPQKVGTS